MKHTHRIAVAVLGALVTGSAFARYADSYFDYAQVLSVKPIVASESSRPVTREECWSEPVENFHPGMTAERQLPPEVDETTGAVTTRTVSIKKDGYYTRDEDERCRTRTDVQQQQSVVAFDVVYSYHNQAYHDRIAHDPGARLRVHVDDGYVEVAE